MLLHKKILVIAYIAFLSLTSITACATTQKQENTPSRGKLVTYNFSNDTLHIKYTPPNSRTPERYTVHDIDNIFPCAYNISVYQNKENDNLVIDGSCSGQGAQIFALTYTWLDKYKNLCLTLIQEGTSANQISKQSKAIESHIPRKCLKLGNNSFIQSPTTNNNKTTISTSKAFIYSNHNKEKKTKKYLIQGDLVEVLDKYPESGSQWYFISYSNPNGDDIYGWIKATDVGEL